MGYSLAHRLIIQSTCIVVAFLNLIVLPYVLYMNKWILNSFKLLMMVFAITNMSHYVLDVYVMPRGVHYPGIAISYADEFAKNEENWWGRFYMCVLMTLFSVQIYNQATHFLYRFILLCKPTYSYFLELKIVSMFIMITVSSLGAYEFLILYSHPSPDPETVSIIDPVVRAKWNLSARQLNGVIFKYKDPKTGSYDLSGFVFMVEFLCPCLIFMSSIVFFGFKTHQAMTELATSMSSSTKKHNRLLFRMLVVQFVVPFTLLFLPGIILFAGPAVVNLEPEALDIILVVILTCPALEPLIAIYFLTKRKLSIFLFCCWNRNKINGISSIDATQLPPPPPLQHN